MNIELEERECVCVCWVIDLFHTTYVHGAIYTHICALLSDPILLLILSLLPVFYTRFLKNRILSSLFPYCSLFFVNLPPMP